MHQPQYVEKLEKILRFLIKEKSLTLKSFRQNLGVSDGQTRSY
jgi:hypothetical protein